ncbi:MAG: AraC family transcriptional regulator [Bacillota bacterium]|jgi:AraC family transcriptional regulator|nr:AraC family transcriptional regulator [Bacillota bacterium]
MESLKQMNLAMKYIEANLDGEIDFGKVAQMAGCSEYHFRRMFSFLSGISLSEYVRRRRLAQAAAEISSSSIKIIDAAVKYGYDSPDSFTRAFQALHGVTPKEARKKGTPLKAVPPMTFQLTIKGGNEMDYRIVEKDRFQIVGLRKRVSLKYHGVNPEIAEMWSSLTMDDVTELKGLSNTVPGGFISATLNFTGGREEGTEIDHVIGVAVEGQDAGRWQVLEVPATSWAVFTVIGKFPDALQDTWARIFSEWFAVSGYELNEGPELLWNEHKDTSLPDYKSEIWIPVRKK